MKSEMEKKYKVAFGFNAKRREAQFFDSLPEAVQAIDEMEWDRSIVCPTTYIFDKQTESAFMVIHLDESNKKKIFHTRENADTPSMNSPIMNKVWEKIAREQKS